MPTEADICNIALARVGVSRPIASLSEGTQEAALCYVLYSHCRDVVLASAPWPFATRHTTLAALADTSRIDWGYGYSLPADFLQAQSIWAGLRQPLAASRIPYAVELGDAGGRILWTDLENAELKYTSAVISPHLFSPLFVNALAWNLASELALPLKVDAGLGDRAYKYYLEAVGRAAAGAIAQSHETEAESELINARV